MGPSGAMDEAGADQDRTGDLLLAKQALSQLSYSPENRQSLKAERKPSNTCVYAQASERPQDLEGSTYSFVVKLGVITNAKF
jgi:hypothetical protein